MPGGARGPIVRCLLRANVAGGTRETPRAMTNAHYGSEQGDQPFAGCGAEPQTQAARTLHELVADIDGVKREIALWFPLSLGAVTLFAAIITCIAAFA